MTEIEKCKLCGEPMPKGEEMFNYHGYSGPCPKPPLQGERMSNEVNTTLVALGEPEWRGEITRGKLEQIIAGLLNPNQGMSKALARKVLALESERDALNKGYQEVMEERLILRQENATLRAERDEFERKGKELCCAYGNALITIHDLKAELARMQRPVSMEEMPVGTTFSQVQVNALMAARAAGRKEK